MQECLSKHENRRVCHALRCVPLAFPCALVMQQGASGHARQHVQEGNVYPVDQSSYQRHRPGYSSGFRHVSVGRGMLDDLDTCVLEKDVSHEHTNWFPKRRERQRGRSGRRLIGVVECQYLEMKQEARAQGMRRVFHIQV